ncbi:MAG: hypothetical protein Q3999_03375 [Buchananella hordeovulneris]|nr:hypothetical protein [Buchananella hordeovulneris]
MSVFVYVAPGAALAFAMRKRGVDVLLFAPVLSVGLVGGSAIVLGRLGVPFNLYVVGAACLLFAALVFALFRLRGKGEVDDVPAAESKTAVAASKWSLLGVAREPLARGWVVWASVAAGLLVGGFVQWYTYLRGFATPEAITQTYDTPFHFSVITYMLEQSNGSSVGAALVDNTIGSSFYPSAWHGTVALVVNATKAWLPVSVNANVYAMVLVVWPLSAMALTRVLLPGRPFALFTTGAVSALFAAFPVQFLMWGVLYSNALSWAILPAAIALFVQLFSARGWRLASLGLGFFVSFVGVALAQPNGVFTAAILLTPFMLGQIWLLTHSWRPGGRAIEHPALWAAVGWVSFLSVMAVAWFGLHRTKLMERTILVDWPAHTDLRGALDEVLTGATPDFHPTPFLWAGVGIAVLVWLAERWLRRDRPTWLVGALLVAMGVYVVGSGVPSVNVTNFALPSILRDILTGFWYHDQRRLAAIPVLVAVPLLAAALDSLARLAGDALGVVARRRGGEQSRGALAAGAVGVLVATLVTGQMVVRTMGSENYVDRADRVYRYTVLDDDPPLTGRELQFMREVKEYLGDKRVLNDPYDGSAFGYSLVGLNVYYRSFEANWIGKPTEDQNLLRSTTIYAATKPEVCSLLERNGLQYLLSMPRNNTPKTGGFAIHYDYTRWYGVDVPPGWEGFTEVMSNGAGSYLYEITACE